MRKRTATIRLCSTQSGFSLIELLIVCVVLLVILGIMTTVTSGVQSSYKTFRDRAAVHNDALAALNLITRIIRNAGNNTSQTALVSTGNGKLQVVSDWTNTNNAVSDSLENVEFYCSGNVLYLVDSNSSPTTSELSGNVSAINFSFFDAAGGVTADMSQVAMVRISMSVVGEETPLVSNVGIRGRIQPK